MLLGSLISVFAKERLRRLFSSLKKKNLGVLGLIPATLIGIASPLCMYGTIPIVVSLAEEGLEEDWIAAFMMSSILLNPQLLFYSSALGRTALTIRLLSCFFCGITAGLLVRYLYMDRGKVFLSLQGYRGRAGSDRNRDPNLVLRLLKNLYRNLRATILPFVLGVALSALFQRYVPPQALGSLFGPQRGFGILMAATVGVPLYVCGGGTIPLLLAWMDMGMSMGSASAFMITGPAMKITNLGALKIVLGAKSFGFYLAFSALFGILTGFLIDFWGIR
ncbi:MAG: permease [Treponema sp.]|nr:permease [Treponema sp.]